MTKKDIIEAIRGLWPRLTLSDGMLLPEEKANDRDLIELWMRQCNGDKNQVEIVLNHVHISDLLLGFDDSPDIVFEDLLFLAKAYAVFLDAEVRRLAPDQQFEVVISQGELPIPPVDSWNVEKVQCVELAEIEVYCKLKR